MKAPPARVNPALLASRAKARQMTHMADNDKDREERLAAALRENLRRRKAQARSQPTAKPADEKL